MTVYGYARVSTQGQSLTAQVAELKAAGCQRVLLYQDSPQWFAAVTTSLFGELDRRYPNPV